MKTIVEAAPRAIAEPEDYVSHADLMWAGMLAHNNSCGVGRVQDWASHQIEHELSAFYDITHGVGLAILTPNWMRYVLSEKTEHRFAAYGVNVWGLDASLPQRELAEKAIDMTREFFCSLGLPATLTEVGIDDSKLELMAQKARGAGFDRTFVPLSVEDIHNILKMSL